MNEILDIFCDEAGHTGPDLLARDQRFFAFSSIAISDAEAFEIITRVRADYPVQMMELKASSLMRSDRGRGLIAAVVQACEGRFAVSVYEKLLALCGWLFEYIYEPVFQRDPLLLYEKNLHRFVAMYTWLWMSDASSEASRAIEEFQRYMRSRDPKDAPFLFANPRPPLSPDGKEHPFESVLRFAYGYRDTIIADNARLNTDLPDSGRWTLDLSSSGIWSHLNRWGRSGKLLSVHCDESKPLRAIVDKFTGDENDPGIKTARMRRYPGAFGWKLAEPVAFVDSRDHPAIQLADVIAGATVALFTNDAPVGFESAADRLKHHVLQESILPDMEIIDLRTRSAAVNATILYGLATRAERQANAYESLEALYRIAEVGWTRGEFNLG